MMKLDRLGYLRAKEFFKIITDEDKEELSNIITTLNNYKKQLHISIYDIVYNLFTTLPKHISRILDIF